jgi:hypothetical protein
MLSKCSGPICVEHFLHLGDGQLFRLETRPTSDGSDPGRLEYFWLCSRCSLTMTLHLAEDGSVVAVPLRKSIQGVSHGGDHSLSHRENGRLLRSVTFLSPDLDRDRAGIPLRVRYHAA